MGEPAFTVCGDGVADISTQPWYDDIPLIKSATIDGNSFKKLQMCEETNFKGYCPNLFGDVWYYNDERGRTVYPIFNFETNTDARWYFTPRKFKSIRPYNGY